MSKHSCETILQSFALGEKNSLAIFNAHLLGILSKKYLILEAPIKPGPLLERWQTHLVSRDKAFSPPI
jgi:hypothetical protein